MAGPAWDGPIRSLTSVGGGVAILAGATLAVLGTFDLGRSLTPFPKPRRDAALVETGVYARIRNPIYTGLGLAAIGWALLGASPAGLAAAGALAVLLDLKSRREEVLLTARFPGYAAYRARTRRFIPGVY